MNNKIKATLLVIGLISAVLLTSSFTGATETSQNESIVVDQPIIEETTTTTSTTIDLSFLNTTTTTVPVKRATTPPNFQEGDGSRWDQLAQCECGGNWGCNTGNGFGGGLQFMHQSSYSTWLSFGGGEFAPHPWEATREQQIVIAERVLARSGWNAWPGCSRKFGWI